MSKFNRRKLLEVAFATVGCALASPSGLLVPGKNMTASDDDPATTDVAERLAILRKRRRHLGPPSGELLQAFERIPRPVLVYDLHQVEENYLAFVEARKDVQVHYAIKACPKLRIVQRVAKLGGGFDVASTAELDLALNTGVDPKRCIYSNTVKTPNDIRYAFSKGVVAFLADSEPEVRKLAKNAPGSRLYVRLEVHNKDAMHPLSGKFGTTPDNVKKLLRLGKTLGLVPYGTHFHVGTQCFKAAAWEKPAREAAAIFHELKKEGIP
ncbi:MAG: hypothetical protein EBV06_13635, partial [Planctomycetia bacterium]|nr:hypothetical protein [Planctomycetia bacterium]